MKKNQEHICMVSSYEGDTVLRGPNNLSSYSFQNIPFFLSFTFLQTTNF